MVPEIPAATAKNGSRTEGGLTPDLLAGSFERRQRRSHANGVNHPILFAADLARLATEVRPRPAAAARYIQTHISSSVITAERRASTSRAPSSLRLPFGLTQLTLNTPARNPGARGSGRANLYVEP